MAHTNPSEIARETLRLLAMRRIPPTPDNYRSLYREIAGIRDEEQTWSPETLRALLRRLPRKSAEHQRIARQVEQALSNQDLDAARQGIEQWIDSLDDDEPPAWNELIGQLFRQWDARQQGWTMARKRDSLERVLSANDPNTLYTRLSGLARAWSQAPSDGDITLSDSAATSNDVTSPVAADNEPARPPEVKIVANGEAGEIIDHLRQILQLTLEAVVPAFLAEQPALSNEAQQLSQLAQAAVAPDDFAALGKRLRNFAYRLEMSAGENAEIQAGLLSLLRLLLANIDQLVLDDQWLHGQVEMLRQVVDSPVNIRLIDDAERRLKDLIHKQGQLKENLSRAQHALREMLAGFVGQLADFAENTGSYHDRIDTCAQRISQARNIAEISSLLDEVMRETRNMQATTLRNRDELEAARQRVAQAEAQVAALQHELEETSRLMRHDQLTGALNRRGLAELFETEAGRAQRRGAPLSVGVLDIDNFKKLNDTYGHQSGDDALVHLINVVRANLRPQDAVARFGGEEFIILYPDTPLEQGQAALVRLQRELTKTFFLADNQKIVITFSAGVTEWVPGEPMDEALKRADQAMYRAKQTGKNKVISAKKDGEMSQ